MQDRVPECRNARKVRVCGFRESLPCGALRTRPPHRPRVGTDCPQGSDANGRLPAGFEHAQHTTDVQRLSSPRRVCPRSAGGDVDRVVVLGRIASEGLLARHGGDGQRVRRMATTLLLRAAGDTGSTGTRRGRTPSRSSLGRGHGVPVHSPSVEHVGGGCLYPQAARVRERLRSRSTRPWPACLATR
jgi:hypothetical protein